MQNFRVVEETTVGSELNREEMLEEADDLRKKEKRKRLKS